jgi:hypothetical protein
MGVYHFIPLGFSPGAATSALAYIKKKIEEEDKQFFGDSPMKISGIVLFTTKEIRNGAISSFIDNEYNFEKGRESKGPIFETVCNFIDQEFGERLKEEKGKIYFCESKLNDVKKNIVNAAKAVLELSPRGRTGKNIWMNITGGNNLITASLILTSFLSGLVGRIYYTFIPHNKTKYLRPTSTATFQWIDIPVLKIGFDEKYYEILRTLRDADWIRDEKLHNILKQKGFYRGLSIDFFRREILNKLHGQGIIEKRNNQNKLSEFGRNLVEFAGLDILKALATPGERRDFGPTLEVIKEF